MAKLTIQQATPAGVALDMTTAASAGGDNFDYSPRAILVVVNDNASVDRTVTIANQMQDNFGGAASLHNASITVPANGGMVMVNLGHIRWKDDDDLVQITYDSEADLSVAVIEQGI